MLDAGTRGPSSIVFVYVAFLDKDVFVGCSRVKKGDTFRGGNGNPAAAAAAAAAAADFIFFFSPTKAEKWKCV